MKKRLQFSIRTLLVLTLVVALLLPIGIANYDRILDCFAAPQKPSAAQIIPALIRRVNPSSSKEIMIRPLDESKIEILITER